MGGHRCNAENGRAARNKPPARLHWQVSADHVATVRRYAGVPRDGINRRKIGEVFLAHTLISEREIDRFALGELRFDIANAEKSR